MYQIIRIEDDGMLQSTSSCKTKEEAQEMFEQWKQEMTSYYEEVDIHISKDGMSGVVWVSEENENSELVPFSGEFCEGFYIMEL